MDSTTELLTLTFHQVSPGSALCILFSNIFHMIVNQFGKFEMLNAHSSTVFGYNSLTYRVSQSKE